MCNPLLFLSTIIVVILTIFLLPVGAIGSPLTQDAAGPPPDPTGISVTPDVPLPDSEESVFSSLPQYDSLEDIEDIEDIAEVGDLMAETAHFYFLARNEYWPVDTARFIRDAEEAFDYVSARMRSTTAVKTIVMFEPPDDSLCPARGLATTDDDGAWPIVSIFADEQTGYAQIMGVIAHEVAHVLQTYGNEQLWASPHRAINEGTATWASGRYWFAWQDTSSFDASVRLYLDQATYLPLYENYDLSLAYSGANCLERRDILYTEWASFIEFLITEFGFDQFQTLLRTAPAEERSIDGTSERVRFTADFELIYGSSLPQLEARWLDYLTAEVDPLIS